MPNISFDHFLTYTSTVNIDDYLDEYAASGFLPEEKTVRHEPGLRNGFIFIGPEYIEFCWVEDRELFDQADEEEKLLREATRPFGIGMVTNDLHALHTDWIRRGHAVPEVWSKAPRDAAPDAPPLWSFQEIPSELLPGASCFALTYHARKKNLPRQIRVHPNTIYAIAGASFVTSEPEKRAQQWRDLLAPEETLQQTPGCFEVQIGPHRASWITPKVYNSTFGLGWQAPTHLAGEIAALHLLASDLGETEMRLSQADRKTRFIRRDGVDELLILPDVRDGFLFSVRQYAVERWLQERMARTGENIVIDSD